MYLSALAAANRSGGATGRHFAGPGWELRHDEAELLLES